MRHLLTISLLAATAGTALYFSSVVFAATKTWDGGGTTNNWSEAANWSDDTVPTAGDLAVFDGTSTKNATIDTNINIGALNINSGYTGTVGQGGSSIYISGAFTQASGTFAGGNGPFTVDGSFTLTGGTFTATSGTTALRLDVTIDAAATFNHNNGTLATGFFFTFIGTKSSLDLNNLIVSHVLTMGSREINVAGTFTLDGRLSDGNINESGDFVLHSNLGGNNGTVNIVGNATRTITIPAGFGTPRVVVNAPNVSINTSGVGSTGFAFLDLQTAASVTNGSVDWSLSTFNVGTSFDQGSGTVLVSTFEMRTGGNYVGGSSTISLGNTLISGGTFTGGSGDITIGGTFNDYLQTGGTFNGGSGTLTFLRLASVNGGTLAVSSGATNFTNANPSMLTIGPGGRLIGQGAGIISIAGTITNDGQIDLRGGTGTCPGNDTILIRSTIPGTQHQWNGTGKYRLVDVDVKDMGGSGTKTVFSGTNSGGNNGTWVFNAGCPAALSISPLTVDKYIGQTQQFTAGGEFGPFGFSLLTNNSGGSITSPGGLYSPGSTPNVTDTVRVTDAFGGTADATVNVLPGPPPQFQLTVTKTGSGGGTINSSPAGINCGANCSALYEIGTTVTLTASSNVNSTFAGWSGSCSGAGSCLVSMTQARSVTATFVQQVRSIAGTITESGSPLANVTVALSGSQNAATITNSSGQYSFNSIGVGGNYTVTPTKTNYTFAPANRTFNNLSANQSNQNFVGTQLRFTISGQILSTIGGSSFALGGVTVILSGTSAASTTTDNNGNYSFSGLIDGPYTVTPTKTNFVFTPASRSISSFADPHVLGFSAQSTLLEGRFAFTSAGAVHVMNGDGSAELTLPAAVNASGVAFSNNGQRIAVIRGSAFIGVMTFDGRGYADLVTSTPAEALVVTFSSAAWSPDDSKIAFIGANGVEVINADGTGRRIVTAFTNETAATRYIDWSPDGTKLLYNRAGRVGATIVRGQYTVDAAAANPTPTLFALGDGASYSPDGTKIAFLKNSDIFLMNPDGSGSTLLFDTGTLLPQSRPVWSPDGAFITFIRANGASRELVRITSAGADLRVIKSATSMRDLSLERAAAVQTLSGTNVSSTIGNTAITFPGVTGGGTTTVTPIPPASAGTLPGGFTIGSFGAFEITTTATVTPPITVCFNLPGSTTQAALNALHILHNESGTLVDRTFSRTFQNSPTVRQICSQTTSLSPFVIAEEVDAALPSIHGLVRDSNDNPMSGAEMTLTGTDVRTATTDSDGLFTFPNLTIGGNYNIEPRVVGYLFNESSTNFVNVAGENAVVFTGTAATVDISGRVTDGTGFGVANVEMYVSGGGDRIATTNANGDYSYVGLPADADYTVTPSDGANTFSPGSANLFRLTGNASNVDFQLLAPSAATASVSGRILTADGNGIRNVSVTLTDATGSSRMALTGSFGYYRFDDVESGATYVISIASKGFTFALPTRIINVGDDLIDVDFIAEP